MRILFLATLLAWTVGAQAQAQGNLPGYDVETVYALGSQLDGGLEEAIELLERQTESKTLAENQDFDTVARNVSLLYVHAVNILLTAQQQHNLLSETFNNPDPIGRYLVMDRSFHMLQLIHLRFSTFKRVSRNTAQSEDCAPYDCHVLAEEFAVLEEHLQKAIDDSSNKHYTWVSKHY